MPTLHARHQAWQGAALARGRGRTCASTLGCLLAPFADGFHGGLTTRVAAVAVGRDRPLPEFWRT